MKLYQKLKLAVLGCLISCSLFAQGGSSAHSAIEGELSGSLYDEKGISIPFATVAVLKLPDSTVVTGSTTDMDGEFSFKTPSKGEYFLKFSSIGYTSSNSEEFKVSSPVFSKDFGRVILAEETTMLNEVMVKTWRPQVKVENGEMTMRVEGTAIAAGNTAYDMLSRAPGVSTDQNGSFMINGRKGIAVMLDGRLTFLSGEELKSLLEGMPAENIEEIEVIHTPPAKYDAEGTSGILNIKFKKNSIQGFSGSVYAGFQYGKQKFPNAGVNLNHNKGKWNSFLNFDMASRGLYREPTSVRTFPGTEEASVYRQESVQDVRSIVPTIHLGSDYDLNDAHSIGFSANMTYRNTNTDWDSQSELGNPQGITAVEIDSENDEETNFRNGRFNLHYTGELDTLGTSISADLDYARLENESESGFVNNYFYPEEGRRENERLSNNKFSFFDIYSARLDFTKPLSDNSSFEAGLKASKVVSDSDLEFFQFEEDQFVLQDEISDRFRYEENIYAAYASYSNKINDTWNFSLGLRAEQTRGEGFLNSTGESTSRDYFKLFPNVMVEQKVSDNYKLNYSFNRRISRPGYQRLNPSIFYIDPYSFVLGNPDLKPQITNSFKLTQIIFGKYNLMLGYDYAKDFMNETPITDPETGSTVFTTENLEYYRFYNATIVAPVKFTDFWNSNNNLILTQEAYKLIQDGESLTNKNFFYMLQSNHQLSLPAEFSLELNATVRGPIASGIYTVEEMWYLDAGLKRSFLKDKLDVSLRFTDIFRTMVMDVNAEYFGNTFKLNQYFYNQAVSLNLRYNFSKGKKAKKKSRPNSLEELNRAGG